MIRARLKAASRLAVLVILFGGFLSSPAGAMEIFIKTVKHGTIAVEAGPDDEVGVILEKIQKKTGIGASLQALVFNGEVVKAGRRLSDYKIFNGYTLNLVVLKPERKPRLNVWVYTGRKVNLAGSGGISPYIYAVSTNNSGAKITENGVYTTGDKPGVTDVVRITDATGQFLEATVEVRAILKNFDPPEGPTTTETLKFTGQREDKKAYDPPEGPTTTETLKFTGQREDKKAYEPPEGPTTTETLKFTGQREDKKAYEPPEGPTTTETLKFTGQREDKKAYEPPEGPTTTETLKFTGQREDKKAYDPLTISPATLKVFKGSSYTFTASGGLPPYTFTITNSSIASKVGASDGEYVVGSGAIKIMGTATDQVQVSDLSGAPPATATITVANALDISFVLPITAIQAASTNGARILRYGGFPPLTVSISDNKSGGTFDPRLATYFPGPKGDVTDVITVTDDAGNKASVSIMVTVLAPPLTIYPSTCRLMPGSPQFFTASGGTGKYTFSLKTNATGGWISYDRYVAGNVTSGTKTDVVLVTDGDGRTAEATVQVASRLTLTEPVSFIPIGSDPVTFIASGGFPPYRFSVIENRSLGATIDAAGNYTPGQQPGLSDRVAVTDDAGNEAKAYIKVIPEPLNLIAPVSSLPLGSDPVTFTATGGVPPYIFSFAINKSGATIDASTGKYTVGSVGDVTDYARVTDVDGNSADASIYVIGSPTVVTYPTISALIQGMIVLTCDPGKWTGKPAFTYQWYREGVKIDGATAAVYTASVSEPGYKLWRCEVTAKTAGGPSTTASTGDNKLSSYISGTATASHFSGSVTKGPYKKGSKVTAINLNNPSQTVTTEVLDDNGSYYLIVPWVGPTRIEATGEYLDEFTGGTGELKEPLSTVTNGVDQKVVECSLNLPTAIASEMVADKQESKTDTRVTSSDVKSTNQQVGKILGLKDGADISAIRIGDKSDPNSQKLTTFQLAVAATAGPNDVLKAVNQFAGEIAADKPLGSSPNSLVKTDELNKVQESIRRGEDIPVKTASGKIVTVSSKDVMRRMRGPKNLAMAAHAPEAQADPVDDAKKILAGMVDAINGRNLDGLTFARGTRVSVKGRPLGPDAYRHLISSALPFLSDFVWEARFMQGIIDPKTGAVRLHVVSTYSAKLAEPVGVTSASLAKPVEMVSAQKRIADAFNTSGDEEIYEFTRDESGKLQVTEIVSALPLDAKLIARVDAMGAEWEAKVAVFGLFYYIEQNDLAKFGALIDDGFVNNDDNNFKYNKADFLESVKADLDHLTSIDHGVRVEDIQMSPDHGRARIPVTWDRRARIANQKTEWTVKNQKTTMTLARGASGFGLAQLEGKPLFGNSSRMTRKTLIRSGELDGATVTAAISIGDSRDTATATSTDFPDIPAESLSSLNISTSTAATNTCTTGTLGQSQLFSYTGAVQNFTVPTYCTLTIKAWGAGGGGGGKDGGDGADGGGGAYSTASVTTATFGDILKIYVGQAGDSGKSAAGSTGAGGGGWGYGSGGRGGQAGTAGTSGAGGGGGGSSAVTNNAGTTFYLVAAGGGGGGGGGTGGNAGGAGGGGGQSGTAANGAGGTTGASGSKDGTDGGDRGAGDGGGAGGGGGGYTAGGTGGVGASADAGGGGGAGGNSTGTVTAASGKTAGNSGDADLGAGLATGGTKSTDGGPPGNATRGGNGYVKISW